MNSYHLVHSMHPKISRLFNVETQLFKYRTILIFRRFEKPEKFQRFGNRYFLLEEAFTQQLEQIVSVGV